MVVDTMQAASKMPSTDDDDERCAVSIAAIGEEGV